MRVRFTRRCAGGCGLTLHVGQQATYRHRGIWCLSCYLAHRARCTRCQSGPVAKPKVREPEPTLF